MDCLLCLEQSSNDEDGIQVYSPTWNELNVQSVIEKHLWPMIMYKSVSHWLCQTCWQILHEFHKLYRRVESIHINLNQIIKSETDAHKSKDLMSVNLLEPEILLDQTVVPPFVKQEEKEFETDNDDHIEDEYKDEDDIPLIHMRTNADSSATDPISDSKHSSSDPPIRKEKSKNNRKRKPKSNSNSSPKSAKRIVRKNDTYDNVRTEPDTTSENTARSFVITTKNDLNTAPRYYGQSKINISEYDSFIAQHFELNCSKCQSSFQKMEELENHFKEAHKKKQCYLLCCGIKFRERGNLVDHINVHLNPEYFKCQQCSEVLTLRKDYKIHMKTHDKLYGCDMCAEKFTTQYLANKHKLAHLPEDEKIFRCDECQKVFESEVLLNSHQRIVHLKKNTRLCEICGQSVLNSETFKRHMEKHEGIAKPVSCEICGRLVGSKRILKVHMQYMHPPEEKDVHVCHICQKTSVNKRALKEHIRRVHSLGCNYKCTMCDKAFKRADHLRDHMATHTGVGTSKCPWCPKVFNANSSMHLHRKKIHPKEWEEERRKRYSGKIPPNAMPQQVNPSDIDSIPLLFSLSY